MCYHERKKEKWSKGKEREVREKRETEKCRFEAGMTLDTAVESAQTCQA